MNVKTKSKRFMSLMMAGIMAVGLITFAEPQAVQAASNEIYIGENGEDINDGTSATSAVKTLDRAYELVNTGGKIVVCGEVTANTNFSVYVAPTKAVTFTGNNASAKLVARNSLYFNADTTFEEITLDSSSSGSVLLSNGHLLKFGGGFKLTDVGTGMIIVGGCAYNSTHSLDESAFGSGSNIIIESGEFGSVVAGDLVFYGTDEVPGGVTASGSFNVKITGSAEVGDLYGGIYGDNLKSNTIYGDSNITVDSQNVKIENILAGSYIVYPKESRDVTQTGKTTINISAGEIRDIIGGSFVIEGNSGSFTHKETFLNITGGTFDSILSGGLTGLLGDELPSLSKLGKMTIKTAIPLLTANEEATLIFSSGVIQDFDGNSDVVNEEVETDLIEVILTGNGDITQIEDIGGNSKATPASEKIITFDNKARTTNTAKIPNGFNVMSLKSESIVSIWEDRAFDKVLSTGGASTLVYEKATTSFPKLTLDNAIITENPIILKFTDGGNTATNISDIAFAEFSDSSDADIAKFKLAPEHGGFMIVKEDKSLVIKELEILPVVTDITATKTSLGSSGGDVTLTVTGTGLDFANILIHDGTALHSTTGSATSVSYTANLPANTSTTADKTYTFTAYIGNGATAKSVNVTVAKYVRGSGSTGDGSRTIPSAKPKTPDELIEQAIKDKKIAVTIPIGTNETTITISEKWMNALVDNKMKLIVLKGNLSIEISAEALKAAGVNKNGKVEISIELANKTFLDEVSKNFNSTENALNKALWALVYDVTVKADGKTITNFPTPIKITFDLSKIKVDGKDWNPTAEEIAKLTIVRFLSNISTQYLGDGFNALTKKVTTTTSSLSKYGVMVASDLQKIAMKVGDKNYSVNNVSKTADVAPVIQDGRTLVPIRFIAEAYGAEVTWNGETSTAKIVLDGKTLNVTIGQKATGMDVAAQLIDDRTMVPLRYVAENFGANVIWDEATRAIRMYK